MINQGLYPKIVYYQMGKTEIKTENYDSVE